MEYHVNFIGLTCFEPLPGVGQRIWMPDGRIPPSNIQSHWGSIAIAPDAFLTKSGWKAEEVAEDPKGQYEYFFPPSILLFPTTQSMPGLDTSQLDGLMISLTERDPNFRLSADPTFIASTLLMHGSVAALTIPNTGPGPGKRQYFARWTVPHAGAGAITIVLQELRGPLGWPVRTLTIKPDSDVSIINTSRGGDDPAKPGDHFGLYARLSGTPVNFKTPDQHIVPVEFGGPLPKYTNPAPATDVLGCSPATTGGGG